MGFDTGMGMGMGWAWLFWLLLLIGGLVVLIVVAVRAIGGSAPRGDAAARPDGGRAREILDERFARGEIGTDEYRERLRELGEGPR